MVFINENYLKLSAGYLFPEITRRVKDYVDSNPSLADRVIRCGVGDVTEPIVPAVLAAMHTAIDELGVHETFRGYPPRPGMTSFARRSQNTTTEAGGSRSATMRSSSATVRRVIAGVFWRSSASATESR